MDKKFLFKLAMRNLFAHKLRTILTLAGIIIGISAVVFLISFGSGIQKLVTEQISGGDAFQLIDVGTGNSHVVKLDSEIVNKISQVSSVSSVATITNLGAKAKKGENTMDSAFFATTANYLDWSGKKIRYGNSLSAKSDQIVVNTSYLSFISSDKPETLLGKQVVFDVIIPKELAKSGEAETRSDQKYTITGIIKDDTSPSVYVDTATIAGWEAQAISQAKVRVSDQTKVMNIRSQIESFGLKTQYVGDTVSQVNQVFSIFKIVLGSFGFIAFLVALLGMFNTLTISLLERVKEIALMKILGMNRRDIRNLFMSEAITLGVVGGIIGLLWGIALGGIANGILNIFALRAGGDKVVVFYYSFGLILVVAAIAILIGFVTGLYPAKRAAKVNALDVLRYE